MAAPDRGSWGSLTLALSLRALVRPRLALDLIAAAWAFRRRGWWSIPPFRMYTAYGDEEAVPPLRDIERFVRWRRELLRLGR